MGMTGPFSLQQAEGILSKQFYPSCSHRFGDMHPITERKMCADQILAAEVITQHRKLAEANLEFRTADNILRVKRVIAKDGVCEIKALDDPKPGFIVDVKVVD
jgi:hypothetical protein